MHGLMSGDWKRSTVSGPQRLQPTMRGQRRTYRPPRQPSTLPPIHSSRYRPKLGSRTFDASAFRFTWLGIYLSTLPICWCDLALGRAGAVAKGDAVQESGVDLNI